LSFLNPSEKQRVPVSVIIPAKNEAGNIRCCLDHLKWADEIYLVDSQSTDGTIEMAQEKGAKVVQFYFNDTYPKKKNWALQNLPFRNEWVLIVDADELIPPELAEEITTVIQRHNGYDGCYINRRFFFLGRWLRHCGYYPSYNLRLFKHHLGRYEKMLAKGAGDNEVHEHIILQGKTGYLRQEMLHFAYPDIATWVEKHNRYSSWEAELEERFRSGDPEGKENVMDRGVRCKRLLKRIYLRVPFRFVFRFFYAYIWKKGFLDGKAGFIFCVLLSFYDFLSWAKAYERKIRPLES
jgi:glycosyltransferase involved in cell wall biosynthesis